MAGWPVNAKLAGHSDAPISVDFTGKYPCLRIEAEAEKGFQDRQLPITPDFAEWLLLTPSERRMRKVFVVAEQQKRLDMISKTITRIGKEARVVVNKEQGKFASAHDMRRAFGTRWAAKVQPATLREIMRHASIETTMKFYVGLRSDVIGEELKRITEISTDIVSEKQRSTGN
ncbi:site-specific integrase [Adhaeretor mobilis]|uniref:Phage integrase family protein n=1 Tax=Adhaeretor mobilis TaxID=1930276 RepID=A0A517MUF2_9BACT|nr:site-specific integrase [Adhaeretor mobilis]QDS98509.1 Phage integrase family protein [Adhaeretor mobilis]